MFQDLHKSIEIPLERALCLDSKDFELKEEFVLKLCKRLHWRKLESSIPTLTKKGFLDTITQIFIKRGKDRNVLEAPILTATKFVIKNGKLYGKLYLLVIVIHVILKCLKMAKFVLLLIF